MSYTDQSEYQEEMQSLLLNNLQCRTRMGKISIPIFNISILLANIGIIVKQFFNFLRSFRTVSPSSPEDIELRTLSTTVNPSQPISDNTADSVDKPFMKPNWHGDIIENLVTNLYSLLWMQRSKTLLKIGKFEIGR